MIDTLFVVPNALFIVAALFFGYRIVRATSRFGWAVGDDSKQARERLIIIKSLLLLFFVSLIAAVFNVFLI